MPNPEPLPEPEPPLEGVLTAEEIEPIRRDGLTLADVIRDLVELDREERDDAEEA